MTHPKNISIVDYTYALPAERIALHPLMDRDASKLLVYKSGEIKEDVYRNIAQYLSANNLLIFNNTRVINARVLFQKDTGGIIEIFLLEPYNSDHSTALSATGKATWKCMIGGASKWKSDTLRKELGIGNWVLDAKLIEKLSDAYVVEFTWTPAELSFAEVLENCGEIPLPPYIKRKPGAEDSERYQTIYAEDGGSVAAPTAGLHFTQNIFDRLAEKNIHKDFVTLHVGAGTFRPVKAATMAGHEMHAEWIEISNKTIENLFLSLEKGIVAVGTTSLRTLESLYWMGVKTILQPGIKQLQLSQWEVYEEPLAGNNITAKEALSSLSAWMKKNKYEKLFTQSQILIAPGYSFKIADVLITNFHQPQSTLLLLVAAAVGKDWRKIYDHAMQYDFRFLSYGDGSLLFISK
ncbi:MAG: S-adenosylmethionine:tRNA ribosyltransferase-isomerase [Chitinophagaceae bacterium]|nr:S-adenosylmethionine:tRNA ribosyltransferase-isomerase [Chitinophagaceae bacterium]